MRQQFDYFAGTAAGEPAARCESNDARRSVAGRRTGCSCGDVAAERGGGGTRAAPGDRMEFAFESHFVGLLRRAGGDVVVVPATDPDRRAFLARADLRGSVVGLFGDACAEGKRTRGGAGFRTDAIESSHGTQEAAH